MTPAPADWRAAVATALQSRDWSGAGDELKGRCLDPAHEDGKPSATWSTANGCGTCHACGAGWNCKEAAALLGVELPGDTPSGTPPGIGGTWNKGEARLSAVWTYRDAGGAVLGHVARYDGPDGKACIPFFKTEGDRWKAGAAQKPRPLYGLDRLAARPDDPVILTEGEKAADAAGRLLPDYVPVTWPGGAKATGAAEWKQLAGRVVAVWPDNDGPGRAAARDVVALLLALRCEVSMVDVEALGLPESGDAADLAELPDGELPLIGPPEPEAEPEADEAERSCWTLRELLQNPVELPPAVVPRVAWPGRATLLAAREKAGKTTFITAAAAAVSKGSRFLGEPTIRGAVLLASEENISDVARRFSDHDADPDGVHVMVWRRDAIEEIRQRAEELRPVLLIVDTLAAVAERAAPESGSSSQWAKIMRPLVRIARDTDAALVILHHSPKAEGAGYRDSGEIGASVDVILELTARAGSVRRIEFKGRYGRGVFSVELVGRLFVLASERNSDDLSAEIEGFLRRHPLASQEAVVKGVGRRAGDVVEWLRDAVASGKVRDDRAGKAHRYRLADPSQGPEGYLPDDAYPSHPSALTGRDSEGIREDSATIPFPPPPIGGKDGRDEAEQVLR